MSQQTSNSLINLGDLAKPIDTLIHKISDATGVLYEPRRMRRKAKAESEAAIISAKAEAAVDIIKTESEIEDNRLASTSTAQRLIQEDMQNVRRTWKILSLRRCLM